jgi:PAS domain S-box-containing protein
MKSPRETLLSFLYATRPLTQKGIGRPGIRVREAVAYILAFTLAVVTLGVFLRWQIAHLHEQEMTSWRARVSSLADDRAHTVSNWLIERQADAQVFATHPSVRAALRAHYDAGQLPGRPAGTLRELAASLDEIERLYSHAGVYILDRNAQVVAQSSRSIPLNPLFSETCRAVSRSGATGIAVVGDAPNRSLMGFSAPVFPGPGTTAAGQPTGQLLGIVLVVSDPAHTLFPLVTRDVVPTRTGETLLVRREGNDMVYFSPLRHVPPGSPNLRFPLSSAPTPASLALEGHETFVEYRDYRGVPVLAATQHIPLTGWGLVRKIDRAEALEDFRRMAIAEWLVAGLLIILLGGLLLFLRRVVMTRVLKREEEKFRALLEAAPDAMVVVNQGGEIVLLNRQAERQFGYRRDELLGKNVKNIISEGFAERLIADALRSAEDALAQEIGTGIELIGRRKDGSDFPIEIMLSPLQSAEGILVTAGIRDISARQRAEEELRRVNRALRTISDCNQVLVRATGESHLLEEVCGILVREGGYRMAWVGFGEHDEGKSVRPVAHAGFEEGYLQAASITWADTERGRGLTGTAIRTGNPMVTRDFRADPRLAPWREEALKRGYASSMALPILLNDHVLGALTIYAEQPGAFDAEEVALLTELSRDLAYGIQTLRARAERNRAEEALRESEVRYRTVVENIPQKIFMKSRDYRWVSMNQNFARDLGVRPEDIVGKADYDLFPKEFADKYHADDKRIMETGVTDEFDEEYLEGNERWIVHTIKTPIRDETGVVIGLLGVFWDVTERQRAEEALRESEERTRIVAESVTDVIYEWDLKDKIEWHGDVDSLMGYPAGGFARTMDGWAATLHPEDLERVRLAIQSQLKGEAAYNIEYRIAGKDGGWRWWSARGTVLRDEQGQPRRWVGAVTDITGRKRAEEEIQKLNEQLEQRVRERTAELEAANKELEAFTYSVSHDLRAPLRHVDGFSKLLVEKHCAELSPDAQEYVAMIRDSVLHMGMLIDDLLNLARVGRKQLSMEVTGLNSLVEEVRTDLNRANPDRFIEWKIEALPFVECDPALMKQVFANLLSNAVKFTRPRQPAVIELGVTSHDGARAVFVRDNGVGFSMKYANKLFGVFQRLHRSEDFEGTGVGLATVQRIIHKHGGRVWAEAELNKGATFYFTLKARDKEKLEAENRNTSGGRSEAA